MFRILLFIAIVILIIISIGGYIASSAGWLSDDLSNLYNTHFSFVTGLASVVGLLAFASSRKIRSTDFETEELEKLQNLMKAAEELEQLETNKNQTEQQLLELERRRKVMELSVKKAGLVLFYQSQIERYEPVILDKVKKDDELKVAVKELIEAKNRLESLNEEVKTDENSELILSILERQNHKKLQNDPVLMALDMVAKSLTKFIRI